MTDRAAVSAWAKAAPRDDKGHYLPTLTPEQRKAKAAKRQRDRRAADGDGVRQAERDHRAANPGQRLTWDRNWRAANLEHVQQRQRARAVGRYGLTIAQWDALFEAQGCRCKICKTDNPGSRRRWATDHDHNTGAVRGILCNRCNVTLGLLGDNADGVRASSAAFLSYLEPVCSP